MCHCTVAIFCKVHLSPYSIYILVGITGGDTLTEDAHIFKVIRSPGLLWSVLHKNSPPLQMRWTITEIKLKIFKSL